MVPRRHESVPVFRSESRLKTASAAAAAAHSCFRPTRTTHV